MELLRHLFTLEPLLALFASIALGYLVGKIKIGSFTLGGIAGTLLVGVVIGQLGINIDSALRRYSLLSSFMLSDSKVDPSSSMR